MTVDDLALEATTHLLTLLGMALPGAFLLYALQGFHFLSAQRLFGRRAVLATGWLGVPVHELAHAIVAVLFGHRLQEVALFRPDPHSSSLGYVRHAYRPGSIVQTVGRFFIGLAPLIAGLLALFGLVHLLVPDLTGVLDAVHGYEAVLATDPSSGVSLGPVIEAGFAAARGMVAVENLTHPGFYLFLAVGLCVALHMGPSPADLWGALPGLVTLVLLVPGYEVLAGTLIPSLPSLLPLLDRMIVWLVALLPISLALAGLGAAPFLLAWQLPRASAGGGKGGGDGGSPSRLRRLQLRPCGRDDGRSTL